MLNLGGGKDSRHVPCRIARSSAVRLRSCAAAPSMCTVPCLATPVAVLAARQVDSSCSRAELVCACMARRSDCAACCCCSCSRLCGRLGSAAATRTPDAPETGGVVKASSEFEIDATLWPPPPSSLPPESLGQSVQRPPASGNACVAQRGVASPGLARSATVRAAVAVLASLASPPAIWLELAADVAAATAAAVGGCLAGGSTHCLGGVPPSSSSSSSPSMITPHPTG